MIIPFLLTLHVPVTLARDKISISQFSTHDMCALLLQPCATLPVHTGPVVPLGIAPVKQDGTAPSVISRSVLPPAATTASASAPTRASARTAGRARTALFVSND